MKIFVIGTRGFPGVQGGVERHCEELYPRLAGLGCDVTVFTRTPYIPRNERLNEWNGVRFIHQWCPRKKSFEAIIHSFLSVMKATARRPDIIHIHGIGPALLAPVAKATGAKIVMTHHGPDYMRAKWGRAAKTILKLGESFGVRSSSAVITISKGIREHVKDLYGVDPVVIPNGVNIPAFVEPGPMMERFGLRPREYVFTACRFVPEKGLEVLIEAYRALKSPAFRLVIAGDADHETDYSRNIKEMASATPGVVLTGFQSGGSLDELFSNAGLFVLPSFFEGLPIALLEALGYGLPVLISDIPQHLEVPLDKDCYFRTGDSNDLSNALAGFNAISLTRGRYIPLMKGEYNWYNIAASTLDIYKGLLSPFPYPVKNS